MGAAVLQGFDVGHNGRTQGFEVISSFENGNYSPIRQFRDAPCHVREGFRFEVLSTQRIEVVGVESRGNEQELRFESRKGGNGLLVKRGKPLLRSAAARHLNIEGCVFRAAFKWPSGAGIMRMLMQADEQDGGIVEEGLLCAVSVMDVPVQNGDAPQADFGLKPTRGYGDIVE